MLAGFLLVRFSGGTTGAAVLHQALGYAVLVSARCSSSRGWLRGTKGARRTDDAGDHYDMTRRRVLFEHVHRKMGYLVLALGAAAILSGLWTANAPRWMPLLAAPMVGCTGRRRRQAELQGRRASAAIMRSGGRIPRPRQQDMTMASGDITILDPRFRRVIIGHAKLEKLWTGARWSEGPAYFPAGRYLVWSDIPNDRLDALRRTDGSVSVFWQGCGNHNGHTTDSEGRLISCEHRTRCVSRIEHDGTRTVLASHWQGKRPELSQRHRAGPDGASGSPIPPTDRRRLRG